MTSELSLIILFDTMGEGVWVCVCECGEEGGGGGRVCVCVCVCVCVWRGRRMNIPLTHFVERTVVIVKYFPCI